MELYYTAVMWLGDCVDLDKTWAGNFFIAFVPLRKYSECDFYPSDRYLWMKVTDEISRYRDPVSAMLSPAPLPWFVYSNLLQNVSGPFINPTHLTWHGYFMHVVRADIGTSHARKLRLKFYVPSWHLSWLKQYTKHQYWKHYLVQTNKLTE